MTENEQILALEAIKKLKARYFRCLDAKDWAGYLAVFTPDALPHLVKSVSVVPFELV